MSDKPSILIFKSKSAPAELLDPILWGIEEEGIPYEVRRGEAERASELALQAASASVLNVGIALGGEGEIVLHHRDLPAGKPLFVLRAEASGRRELRRLGANGARLVKGQPLDLEGAVAGGGRENFATAGPKALEGLVGRILDELLGAVPGAER